MTTQAELKKLAEKHRSDRTVQSILTAMVDKELTFKQSSGVLTGYLGVVNNAVQGEEGFTVCLDHSELVRSAYRAASALECLAEMYMQLAGTLQRLGETVEY